ncbi:MAG: hypothetical protein ABFR02_06060 [Campylobacterota bacterium]
MHKTHLSKIQIFLLIITLFIISGCAKKDEKLQVEPTPVPEITTAYLLEHRIIAYEPKYQEKIIATLPYEIKTFDESYLIYLVARLPDKNGSALLKTKNPRYYLWLERRADNWRDFIAVYSTGAAPLKINAHYSAIREGHYYKEYTIDFTLQQLRSVQESGIDLILINKQNIRSTLSLPKHYIKAFLKMLEKP